MSCAGYIQSNMHAIPRVRGQNLNRDPLYLHASSRVSRRVSTSDIINNSQVSEDIMNCGNGSFHKEFSKFGVEFYVERYMYMLFTWDICQVPHLALNYSLPSLDLGGKVL